jgi:hypothetical protein
MVIGRNMQVCKKCRRKFLTLQTIQDKKRNLCNRHYCLVCSPFGKHNTKQLHGEKITKGKCRIRNKRSLETKQAKLKMSVSKATHILRKAIMFMLAKRCSLDLCFRCGKKISNINEFSIDHKKHWLYSRNPIKLFFSLKNIAFSHLSCNIADAEKTYSHHGTDWKYRLGCRCNKCTFAHTTYIRIQRKRRNERNHKTIRPYGRKSKK